ncbi:MAG: hypothetical protein AMXMBFR64_48900 [Myxococcales bacterium]
MQAAPRAVGQQDWGLGWVAELLDAKPEHGESLRNLLSDPAQALGVRPNRACLQQRGERSREALADHLVSWTWAGWNPNIGSLDQRGRAQRVGPVPSV